MNARQMTPQEAVELLKDKRMEINYKVNGTTQFSEALDLAIKALEQTELNPSYNSVKTELKPSENWKFYYKHGYAQAKRDLLCEDCISREAVMRELGKYLCGVSFDEKGIDEVIKELPSVTPQQTRWIPVSERLPEIIGYYMTTVDYEKHGLAIGPRYYHVDLGWEDDCVIAWMPLPEPYKESEEE